MCEREIGWVYVCEREIESVSMCERKIENVFVCEGSQYLYSHTHFAHGSESGLY